MREDATVKRAIGYLRVSTSLQAEKGMGLEAQRRQVAACAETEGYELIETVRETASGGVRAGETFSWEHRPALLDLMARAATDEYDVLLVAKYDRLSRDYATLVALERELEKHGVEIVSASEKNGDGEIAEYVRGNLALVAQLERRMIRRRLNVGKALRREAGEHTDGRAPYGYLIDRGVDGKQPPKLAIDVATRPIVERIFLAVKRGDVPRRIAAELNAEGIPSPRSRTWSDKAVVVIVTNPAYYGERHGKANAHEAIVTRRTWNAANRALRSRAR
jgi:site-specific DNA recombinase